MYHISVVLRHLGDITTMNCLWILSWSQLPLTGIKHTYILNLWACDAISCTLIFCSRETCWYQCFVIPVPNGHRSQSYQPDTDSFRQPSLVHTVCMCGSVILVQKGLISEVAVASCLHVNRAGWHSVSQNESCEKVSHQQSAGLEVNVCFVTL